MLPDQPSAQSPTPENPNVRNHKLYGPGRPRALDDVKRGEICALIAGGCGLREAAQYVDCSITTIRREAERNPSFEQQLRHSEKQAQLNPLRAMQRATLTHWRAAAWFLERAYPDRFARHEPSAFGIREARALMNELFDTVEVQIQDPFDIGRLKKSIRQAFDRYIRTATERRRNLRHVRLAMKTPEIENQADSSIDPSIPIPEIEALMNQLDPAAEDDCTMEHDEDLPQSSTQPVEPQSQTKSVGDSDHTRSLAYLESLSRASNDSAAAGDHIPPQNSNIQ